MKRFIVGSFIPLSQMPTRAKEMKPVWQVFLNFHKVVLILIMLITHSLMHYFQHYFYFLGKSTLDSIKYEDPTLNLIGPLELT